MEILWLKFRNWTTPLFLTDVPPRPSQSNHLRLIHLTTFASLTQPPMSPWFYHLWNLSLAGECALLHQTAQVWQEDSDKKLMSSTWPTNSPDSNMIKHQRDVFDQVQSMENSLLIWLGSDPSRRGYRTFWGVLWCLEVRHWLWMLLVLWIVRWASIDRTWSGTSHPWLIRSGSGGS